MSNSNSNFNTKFLPQTPYILFASGIFLNFFWIFFREQLSMGVQVAFLALTIVIIAVSSFLAAIHQKGKKKLLYIHAGQWILFVYYLYILSMLLFFGGLFQIQRTYQGEFQLIPFHTIDNYIDHYQRTGSFISFYNLLGNIIVMMPMGYFLPTLFPSLRRFWIFVPLMAVICMGVEFTQWKTGTGIGDIDDSILNFTGAFLAYGVTRLVQMVYIALKP